MSVSCLNYRVVERSLASDYSYRFTSAQFLRPDRETTCVQLARGLKRPIVRSNATTMRLMLAATAIRSSFSHPVNYFDLQNETHRTLRQFYTSPDEHRTNAFISIQLRMQTSYLLYFLFVSFFTNLSFYWKRSQLSLFTDFYQIMKRSNKYCPWVNTKEN